MEIATEALDFRVERDLETNLVQTLISLLEKLRVRAVKQSV